MDATEGAASALLPAAAVTQIPASVLGGMSAAVFLRDYWQKRPLLIRQAVPGFGGIIERDDFLALATREDATSRLVIQHPQLRKGRWERSWRPFSFWRAPDTALCVGGRLWRSHAGQSFKLSKRK